MSENEGFVGSLKYWFLETPDPDDNEHDNIWHHFELFDNHWVKINHRLEWYQSPNVPSIYEDHVRIFKQNMEINRPDESYYKENVDDGKFRSKMYVEDELPSGRGKYRIRPYIWTKNAPSGENDFAFVQYRVDTELKYKMPKGIEWLPRFIARPINRFFKWAFFEFIGSEIVEHDAEFAREKTNEYFQYLRKYHGEEPSQSKSRQKVYKPVPEEGIFFQ